MDFTKTAKKNAKLNKLYQEINAWKVIVPEKSLDNDSAWGSYINDNNNAVISYTKTENKECALAHELLHFSIQKSGYIRMKSSSTTLQSVLMKRLVDCLDNELQHHRMYAQYRSLGYTPKSFYNDADCLVAQYLTDVLDGNKREPLELIPDYMTLIAPGGSLTMKEKQKFSAMFRTSTSAPEVFDTIDGAIKKWTEAASLDQKSVVSSIISSIPGEHSTWIGFDNGTGFPNSGFFVGKPLTKEEFASHMG